VAVAEGDLHERLAVLSAELVRTAVRRQPGAVGEVANDRGLGDRLGHLDVERALPLAVLGFVAGWHAAEPT
jgi:hypothetical protein